MQILKRRSDAIYLTEMGAFIARRIITVLDALELGYAVNVITDGCRGVNIHPQDSAHAFMEMAAAGATLYTLADWEETQGQAVAR